MSGAIKKLLADIIWGYGLSGERRKASYRNWRRNYIFALLCAVVILPLTAYVGDARAAYLLAGIGLLVAVYALIRRDTGWQLWFRERRHIRESRVKNEQDLQEFIDNKKKAHGHGR